MERSERLTKLVPTITLEADERGLPAMPPSLSQNEIAAEAEPITMPELDSSKITAAVIARRRLAPNISS
jgi:hypothetical protein